MTETQREKLVELLARRAYSEGNFELSSGVRTNIYLDAKQVTYSPEGVEAVGNAVLAFLRQANADAVGGLTMGADAIVASTVWASLINGRPVPGFVVRKEPKPHGLQKWIEGVSPQGRRVAIVDDVITSGKSVLQAVQRAQEEGAEVVVVIGLIDREEGGAQAIEAQTGIPFHAVCTLAEIQAVAELGQSTIA
jgi:orotate phosphoribosyltransferase